MGIIVNWSRIVEPTDAAWNSTRVLYAYVHPHESKILYIGKVFGETSSIRKRRSAADKNLHWDFCRDTLGLDRAAIPVLVGDLETDRRLTRELMGDIESLLIKRLQPILNVQSTKSRTARPRMTVRCTGSWPHAKKFSFRDIG
jgi:hypothetical protein